MFKSPLVRPWHRVSRVAEVSGWGPEATQPPGAVRRRFVLDRPRGRLGCQDVVAYFSRGQIRLATNLERFFPPQTKNLDFRRKWDKDEYEKLAEKRLTEEREKKDGGCLFHQGLRVSEVMLWLESGWRVEMPRLPLLCNLWQNVASLGLDFFTHKMRARRWTEVVWRCFPALLPSASLPSLAWLI